MSHRWPFPHFLTLFVLTTLLPLNASAPEVTDLESPQMTSWQAVILGVVEGVTEFLPVSSTGHLILTSRALGLGQSPEESTALNSYLVVIQIGAILAVVAVYASYIKSMILGVLGKDPQGLRLTLNLLIAFFPAALLALILEDLIKGILFGLWPVTIAWFIGGVALMIWGEKSKDQGHAGLDMEDLNWRRSLIIGLLQCLALWPGTSRSLVTILGGRLAGLNLKASVVFSFLLGTLTLSAATCYDLLSHGRQIIDQLGADMLIIGSAVAGLSAWVAVKGMVGYLKKHGLGVFGMYRVCLAILTGYLLYSGVLSA